MDALRNLKEIRAFGDRLKSLKNSMLLDVWEMVFRENRKRWKMEPLDDEIRNRGGLEEIYKRMASDGDYTPIIDPRKRAEQKRKELGQYAKQHANDRYCQRCGFNMGSYASRRYCCWYCDLTGFLFGGRFESDGYEIF